MKKFFILEDDLNRMEWFLSTLALRYGSDVPIYYSDNVDTAKNIFAQNYPYDTIFLDHDLGGQIYVPSSDPNTGCAFAKWLVTEYGDTIDKDQVIVHSCNVVGAGNIKALIPTAELIPFPFLRTIM